MSKKYFIMGGHKEEEVTIEPFPEPSEENKKMIEELNDLVEKEMETMWKAVRIPKHLLQL